MSMNPRYVNKDSQLHIDLISIEISCKPWDGLEGGRTLEKGEKIITMKKILVPKIMTTLARDWPRI